MNSEVKLEQVSLEQLNIIINKRLKNTPYAHVLARTLCETVAWSKEPSFPKPGQFFFGTGQGNYMQNYLIERVPTFTLVGLPNPLEVPAAMRLNVYFRQAMTTGRLNIFAKDSTDQEALWCTSDDIHPQSDGYRGKIEILSQPYQGRGIAVCMSTGPYTSGAHLQFNEWLLERVLPSISRLARESNGIFTN